MEETRRYNKDYLIRKVKNGGDYVRFYSYRACTVITSQELKNGVPVRVVAMRKSDCAKYLTKDEISGILKSLGMRRDGSLKAEQTGNSNMVFFYQPLKAASGKSESPACRPAAHRRQPSWHHRWRKTRSLCRNEPPSGRWPWTTEGMRR